MIRKRYGRITVVPKVPLTIYKKTGREKKVMS
jgi:hypothetical protein